MKRIAIVNQRYGKEVNGGSEDYARELAHRLSDYYKVDVLTTTALNYMDWDPYYKSGIEQDDRVTVRRFPVLFRRMPHVQNLFSREWFHKKYTSWFGDRIWLFAQGPFCPALVHYIRKFQDDYDVIIFVTYLYYPTVIGAQKMRERYILLPTAHDEGPIHYDIYKNLFLKASSFLFLTEEERQFIYRLLPGTKKIDSSVIGAGICIPETDHTEESLKKFSVDYKYILYVGRIENGKGCVELFNWFREFISRNTVTEVNNIKLLLIGKAAVSIPDDPSIVYLGYLSDNDKYAFMKNAEILILPSKYESLSLVVLEAMSLGTPVLVNGKSEVLRGHCKKSGAGCFYNNQEEFDERLKEMLGAPEMLERMGQAGKAYVKDNFTWDATIQECLKVIGYNDGPIKGKRDKSCRK